MIVGGIIRVGLMTLLLVGMTRAGQAEPSRLVPSEPYLYDVVAAATVLVTACGEPKALLERLNQWAGAYGLVISSARAERFIDDETERHGRWPDKDVHCGLERNYVADALNRKAVPRPPATHASAAAE